MEIDSIGLVIITFNFLTSLVTVALMCVNLHQTYKQAFRDGYNKSYVDAQNTIIATLLSQSTDDYLKAKVREMETALNDKLKADANKTKTEKWPWQK